MSRRDSFSGFHPSVVFLYFALVIGFAMCLMHPVCLAISLVCALCYSISLSGGETLRLQLAFVLPMMVLTTLINFLFNHHGDTVLTYLPGGNPLTLESALYGLAAAVMLWAVVAWFGCYNAVMTSDKFLCLFGKLIPSMALVLTMTLGFVPRFRHQLQAVVQAQRCLGRSLRSGPLKGRLQTAVTILSVMLTWSLESSIETSDSMKSRGYGLPGRTTFALYRFENRDKIAMVWLLSCGFLILWGLVSGEVSWQYFPAVKLGAITPMAIPVFAAYLALCLTPLILQGKEALMWRRLSCAM